MGAWSKFFFTDGMYGQGGDHCSGQQCVASNKYREMKNGEDLSKTVSSLWRVCMLSISLVVS